MVTFGDVLAFDPEQIREIFRVCTAHERTCTDLGTRLKNLDTLQTWAGEAATAAKRSAGRTRIDLGTHGNEVRQVALAARDCYHEGVALRRDARACETDARAAGLVIDPKTGKVSDPKPPNQADWSVAQQRAYTARITALQNRVNGVVTKAAQFDENLAAAINAADGRNRLRSRKSGDSANMAARKANQMAAFRATYGRDPVSDNEWKIASILDAHTYNPKYKGVPATVKVAQVTPIPGKGIVTTNLYIPGKSVTDGVRGHRGDNRGADPNAGPEDSRVTYVIDYDTGMVIARQNPSVTTSGQVAVAEPSVRATQLKDGSIKIDYDAYDPLQPAPKLTSKGVSVNGTVIYTPTPEGIRVSGNVTNFPSMEVYERRADGATTTLHTDDLGDHTPLGPATGLPFHHDFGDYREDLGDFYKKDPSRFPFLKPPWEVPELKSPGVPLGDPKNPPIVEPIN